MFRVNSSQAVLRVLLASVGLMVCGAVAQGQTDQVSPEKPTQDTAVAATTQPVAAAPVASAEASSAQPAPTQSAPTQSAQAQPAAEAVDPLKRPTTEKQRQKNSRGLKQELSKTYKKWLDEDVVWIITDEERAAFKQLSNDEERDNFIEAFWQRRDPTPGHGRERI